MLKYVFKRILAMIPVLFIISIVIFGTVKAMPGDEVTAYFGAGSKVTQEQRDHVRELLGLDKSLPEQYVLSLIHIQMCIRDRCEYYALEGLPQLIHTIDLVKERLNKRLKMEGVVFTMYDARTNLSLQVVENVKENLNQNIYKTIIPRNVRLAEAPSYGQPITIYDPRSSGADVYKRQPYERRIIHSALQGNKFVETVSEGEERCV